MRTMEEGDKGVRGFGGKEMRPSNYQEQRGGGWGGGVMHLLVTLSCRADRAFYKLTSCVKM